MLPLKETGLPNDPPEPEAKFVPLANVIVGVLLVMVADISNVSEFWIDTLEKPPPTDAPSEPADASLMVAALLPEALRVPVSELLPAKITVSPVKPEITDTGPVPLILPAKLKVTLLPSGFTVSPPDATVIGLFSVI